MDLRGAPERVLAADEITDFARAADGPSDRLVSLGRYMLRGVSKP